MIESQSKEKTDSDDDDWSAATTATSAKTTGTTTGSVDPVVFVEIDGWITIRMRKSVAELVSFL